MNGYSIIFLILNGIALLMLPRIWAVLPLLLGACYMTLGQVIELGPLHFSVIRILIAIGILRVIIRGERLTGKIHGMDWFMVLWAAWAIICTAFYKDTFQILVNRFGLVYNACGVYLLLRILCRSLEDVERLCHITAILLIPLSILMFYERTTGYNPFSLFGGVAEMSEVRSGRIRAQGPFAHPILAGTVGAVSLPLMIGIWQRYRRTSTAGITACLTMVYASGSSGPILSAISAIAAMLAWRWRHRMSIIRWGCFLGYIGLDLVMNAPAYYILARIDLTGGSTGWHRAELINSAIRNFSEWWLVGTDYTRHWMPTGVPWNENHTDITNHFLNMGVYGGLPLMFLFVCILVIAFSYLGRVLHHNQRVPDIKKFTIWTFGSSLFSQTISFLGVTFFDQSFVFIYLVLAAIGSIAYLQSNSTNLEKIG